MQKPRYEIAYIDRKDGKWRDLRFLTLREANEYFDLIDENEVEFATLFDLLSQEQIRTIG